MAKKFYYDSVGVVEATITAGTYNSSTNVFSVSAGAITDEHYINDQSLIGAVTAFHDEDMIRIDLGSAGVVSDIVLYNNGSKDFDDLFVYQGADPTGSLTLKLELETTFAGWNANALTSSGNFQYLFLRSEDGEYTGLSEVILGVPITFDHEPDIGGSTQKKFATDINTSLGGIEYAYKRHDSQSTWTLNFKNISQSFKDKLASMEAAVTDYKKFVYYDGSAYNYVRLDGPINFTEVAYQRYSTSIKLREQLS